MPFLTAKAEQAEKDVAAGKAPAIAGLPQGAASSRRAGREAEVRLLQDPARAGRAGFREGAARARDAAARGQQEASKDVYFIQAGSFQNPADADNQKARLAILGFESSVEPANLPDKGTWYRVRLGPYNKVEEINRVRQALAQNGIDASLVKIKEQP